ncbi:oxidoreductase of aldo/keto reductase family, subgroup 1 [Melissococcus plutonius ATCC 35311]|uniref:Oxidoreductase of aldo/keto reductase family, subgroup 1 n=1 Tax=Melissococcus plutonius (strain ATCC 35311 / DSM 29964 / CIP 104052 / LMG 20360 / NCIMB 702443) TaxID=940190 RepID=F3Y8J9_MELPT|nr:diketogulonate reductase-like aldo/keto reductase [Melissococcus plutonius]BAK20827.1 oxidoreductase of aldo/keto reductase family, subgroup 1 [Melissococcus plutonius ATCC 35311]
MNETFTLANNIKIPKIGFGTWMIKNEDAAKNVQDAIQVGYRHIDTAEAYQNEQGVGEGIHASGINRKKFL